MLIFFFFPQPGRTHLHCWLQGTRRYQMQWISQSRAYLFILCEELGGPSAYCHSNFPTTQRHQPNMDSWRFTIWLAAGKNVVPQRWPSSTSGKRTFNPFTPKSAKFKTEGKVLKFILQRFQKQTVPLESTAQKLSFEWSQTRVSSTDLKVRYSHIYWLEIWLWEWKGLKCVDNMYQSKSWHITRPRKRH